MLHCIDDPKKLNKKICTRTCACICLNREIGSSLILLCKVLLHCWCDCISVYFLIRHLAISKYKYLHTLT